MGKGGSTYHERERTPEERALAQQQADFINSIRPATDKLVSMGTSALDDVFTPDWSSLYANSIKDLESIREQQARLADGILPQQFSNAKIDYMNRLYENTMGQQLNSMAKRGVVDSSRFNTTMNDIQKNMTAQMSKDYTQDLNSASRLMDQKYNFAKTPLQWASEAQKASLAAPSTYLGLAMGNGKAITGALSAQTSSDSSRGYITQDGPGFFGGLMGGLGGFL